MSSSSVNAMLVPTYLRWEALAARGVRKGLAGADHPAAWRLAAFAGRLGEVSGDRSSAALTLVFRLVLEAQRSNEPAAWVAHRERGFFPPDVARGGVDLRALVVVWVASSLQLWRAGDTLLRSGAFGLVVLDLGARARMPLVVQSRLSGLAQKHDSALLCITEKSREHPSLGSLVSIRAEAIRLQRRPEERFLCASRILKDKRHGPGWTHEELYLGPHGLR